MYPIEYKECNYTYGKNQKEYNVLPVCKDNEPECNVVSCWKFTFRERLRLLFGRKLWLHMKTFHEPLQPVFMTTKKSDIFGDKK
jgi:hypothetical protein